ncbi:MULTISPECIES: hypothetical protein [unclassified Bacillus (in: firmicutes)]|uniref:hypothetical protein n=1 Tax=unclassified Bacillus (in: firmicutes) TaxID=185979 RepID=UPI0015876CEE|nr:MULTISPECIES: hypothetical protein [unclassified Bacillus (in: firmicutes)]
MKLSLFRHLFLTFTFVTVLHNQVAATATLEVKNPPRLQSNIVTTIQGFFQSCSKE